MDLTAAHYSRATADGVRGDLIVGLAWRQIQRGERTDVPDAQIH